MTNLEWLDLSNSAVYGRLESLDNLDSLTTLAIANTQVSNRSMGGRPTYRVSQGGGARERELL